MQKLTSNFRVFDVFNVLEGNHAFNECNLFDLVYSDILDLVYTGDIPPVIRIQYTKGGVTIEVIAVNPIIESSLL